MQIDATIFCEKGLKAQRTCHLECIVGVNLQVHARYYVSMRYFIPEGREKVVLFKVFIDLFSRMVMTAET